MIVEPRLHIPNNIKSGDVIAIQAAISHPMLTEAERPNPQSPDAKNPDTKSPDTKSPEAAAKFIEVFVATFEGKVFFRTRFLSAISANPYLYFTLKVPGPGTLEVQWVENSGETWSLKRKLNVK